MSPLVRLRRNRYTIAIAVFIIIVLFQLSSLKSKASSGQGFDRLREYTRPAVPPQAAVPAPKPVTEPPKPEPPKPVVVEQPKLTEPESKQPKVEQPSVLDNVVPIAEKPKEKVQDPVVPVHRPEHEGALEKPTTTTTPAAAVETVEKTVNKIDTVKAAKPPVQTPKPEGVAGGIPADGRVPYEPATTTSADEHYSFPTPYYPVPSPLISIPPPLAAVIPKIQAEFPAEPEDKKTTRLHRQALVKQAFLNSWNAYKKDAMGHDELAPVTLTVNDPFGGWGATLVDALDTLWIMGLKDEFDEAMPWVGKIDFTTNSMQKMRVFETVIRYLGGLVGAWDLSTEGGNAVYYKNGDKAGYKVLLDKAIELADVLMGAFDTPNRMPILAWGWRSHDLEGHPRADTHSVAAELGSLSMEFTRLAQITGNQSYYDAVARITNELDTFQSKTSWPGLFPIYIDASGCKKIRRWDAYTPEVTKVKETPLDIEKPIRVAPVVGGTGHEVNLGSNAQVFRGKADPVEGERELRVAPIVGGTGREVTANMPEKVKASVQGEKELRVAPLIGGTGKEVFPNAPADASPMDHQGISEVPVHTHDKRQVDVHTAPQHGAQSTDDDDAAAPAIPEVKPKPLIIDTPAQPKYPIETVPRDRCEPQGLAAPHFIREEKYGLGAMIDSLYEYLLKQYLLLGGNEQYKRMYSAFADVAGTELTYRPNTPGNPDILLAGQVYVTRNGEKRKFEPESSHLACFAGGMFAMGSRALGRGQDYEVGRKLSTGCAWAYESMKKGIMPEAFKVSACKDPKNCVYSREKWVEELMVAEGFADPPISFRHTSPEAAAISDKYMNRKLKEASLKDANHDDPTPVHHAEKRQIEEPVVDAAAAKAAREKALFLTEDLIEMEDIPEGFIRLNDRRYILRPEAIESVWYMYRITGDVKWANQGFKMWQGVIDHVTVKNDDGTDGAASAIKDVNDLSITGKKDWEDSMESFWFGETLKYFYLLFSDPDVISLDDYVLNTEAHPFRRADFGKRGVKPGRSFN